ncbi:hypothetical protein J437_LFUL016462 [Ladona fulva]|uniref:PiggyBac transposable element-derived protein domain-containing protein n=1 Tax=Ladona fulva TaxID=123851 RepID=A0A8K0PAK4_LADFU|nr:hypothetical protein J437_LFUL016462 [Ladona fulva]
MSLCEDSILEILTRSDSEEDRDTDSEESDVTEPSTSGAPKKWKYPDIDSSSGSDDTSEGEEEMNIKRRKTASQGAQSDIVQQNSDLGKSGDIVSTLINPYLEKGHTLYVDNWYTSPALFCWLHDRATNACGTVRKNRRNMPKMEEKLKKGAIRFKSSEKLLALKWCSKRESRSDDGSNFLLSPPLRKG